MSEAGTPAPPILVVGLDGVSHEILEPLLAGGDLPTLARLLARGASGVLHSVVPPITPAAWSSFMTGKLPGKHGVYDFRIYDPRSGRDSFVTSRALREPTVWELLTAAGRRVAVVNLPVMYPPKPTAGTVVSGFDTPSTAVAFTHPPALRERILARIPDYFFVALPDPADPNLEGERAFEDFAAQVERAFAQRTRVALDLLADERWDVFMLHYQDTDAFQHLVWRFIADHERHPERWSRIREVYRRLDGHLAELLAAAAPGTLVLVVSDHGFGSHDGRIFPNVLLRRWGYLTWRGRRRDRLLRSLRKRLRRLGLAREDGARTWLGELRARGFERDLPLVWRQTRAYVALAEIYGLVYLNVRGREPKGTVAPGAERRALAAELRERFLAVRHPGDGKPVFADVVPGDTAYPDDPLDRRPDLVLIPRPGYTVYRDLNHRRWIDTYRVVSGTHRPEGILIASGPGIRPGRLSGVANLVDLAPTLLAVAGVPLPPDLDGRVLTELFTVPPAVTTAALGTRSEAPDAPLAADEEEEVMRRLRALGYLA